MRSAGWNELKLPSNCRLQKPFHAQFIDKSIVRERECCWELFLAPEAMYCKLVRDFEIMQSLGLSGLVFDTGLSVTPPMGQQGCSSTPWSVPVLGTFSHEACSEMGLARYKDLSHWPVLNDSQTTP